ncbi:hypothetical protein FG426_001106 [Yersinia enterocolitica]|uniref:hypothetical protein n=1 Tax=Yersinia enterocolitica TaxID=630 RepID=UPI0027F95262|nr:hypothetical protein [Yersinia enterocolitica]EKN4118285.1 hypothetical protein [Yersinia enterocolitica]EKN4743982.1 hypothetical protein [Yersinia enterocolitica]EKN4837806.1 hypothetical protein [Yersinia enterocolitica]ELI8099953.1 hypothetical protein [Yersinia enterocolitica]
MRYELPSKKGSYTPELYAYLCSINTEYLHNTEHGLMHPADVFTTVFDEVVASGQRLVTAIHEMEKNSEKRRDKHVNSLISGFLYSISNFIDGCKSIMKCLFKKNDEKNYKKIISEFMSQCRSYIDYVNTKVNFIKHRHRSISTILCEWEGNFIIGYYINGPVSEDVNGPDPEIHKDVNCAISMNWDIPYHIVNIYWLSASLKAILENNRSSTIDFDKKYDEKEVINFLADISLINRFLLPDEFNKKQASVKKKDARFILEYPSKVKALNNHLHKLNISMTAKIGIGAKGFVTPYLR